MTPDYRYDIRRVPRVRDRVRLALRFLPWALLAALSVWLAFPLVWLGALFAPDAVSRGLANVKARYDAIGDAYAAEIRRLERAGQEQEGRSQ